MPQDMPQDALSPHHFGDIMSSNETRLVFPPQDNYYTPIERILLTANGNLQRILSAYFNATVTVDIIYNNQLDDHKFSRMVYLKVNDEVLLLH